MPMSEDESTTEKRTDKVKVNFLNKNCVFQIFNTFDTDHDGKLSREEFIQGNIYFLYIIIKIF